MQPCDKGPILEHHSQILGEIKSAVVEIAKVSKQTAVQQEQINNINLRLNSQADDIRDIKKDEKDSNNALWKEIREIKSLPMRVAISIFTGVSVTVIGALIVAGLM